MTAKTLAQKIRDFSKVKLTKASVKIPKLKVKKTKVTKQKKDESLPISSIVNILIKSAVEKAREEKKGKLKTGEDKSYAVKDNREIVVNGGYGTISKGYGIAPHTSYVDYEKLFSYLGKFRSQSPYENITEHVGALNKATESGSFVLADRDAIDKIGRFDKYIKNPVMDMPIMALSLVPIAGLSSGEWEEVKMLMKLDPIMYTLKTKTA